MDKTTKRLYLTFLIISFLTLLAVTWTGNGNGNPLVSDNSAISDNTSANDDSVFNSNDQSVGNVNCDSVISGNGTNKYVISKASGVEFNDLNFTNFDSLEILDGVHLKFTNCTFTNFTRNGIVLEDCNSIEFDNCVVADMGSNSVDDTWEGMGICSYNGSDIKVSNTEISNTYGHGAIFFNKTSFTISNNTIHDTRFRAIEIFDSASSGTIRGNKISNCGAINTSNSGVGCNGIFADASADNVDVIGNKITNVYENAIEGIFKSVTDNIIDGTGTDPVGHPTPSTEGIFITEGGNYLRNVIRNTYGPALKRYSTEMISNVIIKDNTLYKSGTNTYSIDLNSETGYSNITIMGNKYSTANCVGFRKKTKANVVVQDNDKFRK